MNMITTPEQVARKVCREDMTNRVVVVLPNSSSPPKTTGHGYYFTTPSGKTIVHHPNAYGYPTLYHGSTLAVEVGDKWLAKIKSRLENPPKGMKWKRDKDGIFLERQTDGMDFHITCRDIARKNLAGYVRGNMAANYKNRLQAQRLEKQFSDKVSSTLVTFTDARRAGNCVEGILGWAKRKLGMDKEQFLAAPWLVQIPAKLLLRLDPENQLVKNSINQAWLRENTVSI
jgi:hypothetical protein